MVWNIDKEFNFEAGHRVWAQKLEHPGLSLSTHCACKNLHGHSYTVKVFLGADNLDHSAMVTDFKNLNFMKQFVDNVLDHKFILDINDPYFGKITGLNEDSRLYLKSQIGQRVQVNENNSSYRVNFWNVGIEDAFLRTGRSSLSYSSYEEYLGSIDEYLGGIVVVNFVPTSENICKYLFEYAKEMIGDVAKVTAVELWETKKSHCRYEE